MARAVRVAAPTLALDGRWRAVSLLRVSEDPSPAAPPNRPPATLIARRRLLVALGFGATNVAVLRHLAVTDDESAAGATVDTAAPTTTTAPADGPRVSTDPVPVLDQAVAVDDPSHVFDLVITGGRVMDPASGYDGLASVGVDGTRVTSIVAGEGALLNGRTSVDATGLVVAPGFIDILSYSPNGYGEWFKISDGVTTNLGMHGLDDRASIWFVNHPDNSAPVHFGGAYDNATVRPALGLDPFDQTTTDVMPTIIEAAERDLADGYIGLHMQPEYTPGATPEEVRAHATLAARHDVPLCVHARYSDNLEPGTNLEAIDELVNAARDTGARIHVEHINSTGGTGVMAEALGRLSDGRAEGLALTACVYPYEFWATYLKSARYDNWQEKYGISYGDLQVAGTSERLTEATYQAAYDANQLTAAYAIPPEDIELALKADFVMIGSDAILETSHNNHPRSTGCFARVLGRHVRELGTIDLMSALSKMTIQPARLVEGRAPALRRKGRLQVGADADVTVFDPATVADRSTIADPAQRSVGIEWVAVEGQLVETPSGPDQTTLPGRAIRSDITLA
jgi:N-acyl-D-aspartate/D-glutamate deacylase